MTDVVVRRVVAHGRLVGAQPLAVLSRTDDGYWAGLTPGTRVVDESHYCAWLRGVGDRREAVDAVASRDWSVDYHVWRWNIFVRRLVPGAWWTATAVFDEERRFRHWYVDFHRPLAIADGLVDVHDLLLDAIIGPSGSLRWKDEDEFADACRIGRVTTADREGVEKARAEVAQLVREGAAPFDGSLPDAGAIQGEPELPPGWDAGVIVRWRWSDLARS